MIRGKKLLLSFILTAALSTPVYASTQDTYTVQSGDSLWKISNSMGVAINTLKVINYLDSDTIQAGQVLKTSAGTFNYTVKSGDTISQIAKTYNTTTEQIMSINKLSSDIIYVGQVLLVPVSQQTTQVAAPIVTTPVVQAPAAVTSWPSITYIVKAGDSVSLVAKNFGIPMTDLLKYNYMTLNDWLNAGQKIAINGYAPRTYTVFPSSAPRRNTGTIVDWFLEGQYILRRNDVVQITDTRTGKNFAAKIMGGYNHMDIEPLTSTDTAVMKSIFTTWKWDPRPVAIYKKGMNIAASLSGMPHSFDTVSGNGVSGHFDLYLKNSKPHSSDASASYVQQHYNNIPIAAGQ